MSKKTKVIRLLIIVACILLIALAIYLPLELSGLMDKINSAEDLKEVILSGGVYSYLVFFAIQFLQTSILPIPAVVSTVAGSLVFGPIIASVISFFAVVLASIVCFALGRKFGRKLLVWVAGEKDADKYQEQLSKGKYAYFLMMLFPFFPDDILCIVAGATPSISYKYFMITILITRPITILCSSFFMGGHIIPFSGWGIPVWIALVVAGGVLFYLSIRYQEKIQEIVDGFLQKLKKKDKSEKSNSIEVIE